MVLARTQRSQRSGDPGALGAAHLASCGPIGTEGDRLEAPRRFLSASSCCAPRARPRSLEDQSGARPQASTTPYPKPRPAGCSLFGPEDIKGGNAVVCPRPGQTGPLPRRKATRYTLKIQLV